MNDIWRNACKKLQNEGVRFDYKYPDSTWTAVNTRWWFKFSKHPLDYRIAQQPIPHRPDWREWCKKVQNECGVKFDYMVFKDDWRNGRGWDFNKVSYNYRIAQQPITEQIINYLQEEQMKDKIMMDGEPLEVGDAVYCLLKGAVAFNGVCYGDFPIVCVAPNGRNFQYTKNFTYYRDGPRTLFWQKPEIIPPPKPKKKVKVWDWFTEDAYGNIKKHAGIPEDYMNNSLPQMQYLTILQKIDGTEREVEQ